MANLLVQDVFRSTGTPTHTYVHREKGALERRLNEALDARGYLCLITGPSKSGKSTLFDQVLKNRGDIPLKIECDASMGVEDIWLRALEGVNFERISSRSSHVGGAAEGSVKVGAKLSWPALAKLSGELASKISGTKDETEQFSRILASPHPSLLIPVLSSSNAVLVVEDFHYLHEDVKTSFFQQVKRFIDNQISIILLSTTHRAVDIAQSNKDLYGRVDHIDVGRWSVEDLKKIIENGLSALNVSQSNVKKLEVVAEESVGIPIITQQVCSQIFLDKDIDTKSKTRRLKRDPIRLSDVHEALHRVATRKYSQFSSFYSTLIRGPREKARKYPTYEAVIACFAADPLLFELTRSEIDERISRIGIDVNKIPPAPSINSTLGALKKFQEARDFELLEWRAQERKLYILEPAFLFYVRWRRKPEHKNQQLDFFEIILEKFEKNIDVKLTDGSG